MSEHQVEDVSEDDAGWWWVACSCEWASGPFPGRGEALDEFADHCSDHCAPTGAR